MLGDVPPGVEAVHSATVAAEPEPTKEVEVTEAPAVDSVDGVTPDAASEEKPTVGEPEVPVPVPQEVEEPPLVEELPGVTEQEVPAPAVPEPAVEPAAEEPASGVPEPELPNSERAFGDVPPVEPESVTEPQEPGAVPPVIYSEEKPSPDEAEPEEVTPAISEPVEATQDVPTSDVPQEESNEIEHSQSPWRPSYSVSFQGGGLDNVALADEEAVESTTVPEPPVEEPITESAPVPEIVTPVEVCLQRFVHPA